MWHKIYTGFGYWSVLQWIFSAFLSLALVWWGRILCRGYLFGRRQIGKAPEAFAAEPREPFEGRKPFFPLFRFLEGRRYRIIHPSSELSHAGQSMGLGTSALVLMIVVFLGVFLMLKA